MRQIAEMIQKAKAEGYNEANAEAKVCQDIVRTLISQTSTAPYKYPRIVEFREELPKTISGKIQRNKL